MKKLKKEKRLLLFKITAVVLLCCVFISVAYTAITIKSEKNNLINTAHTHYSNAYDTFELYLQTKNVFYYLVNVRTDDSPELNSGLLTDDFANTQVIIRNSNGEIVGENGNYYCSKFKFFNNLNYSVDSYVDFQKLKNSLSQEDFNEIVNTLKSDETYKLICSEFAYENTEIFPTKLTIARKDEKPFKEYTLNVQKSYVFTTESFNQNQIPLDFLLGKYESADILSTLGDTTCLQFKAENNIVEESLFTFVFYEKNEVEFYKNTYTIEYARRYNILKSCQSEIIIGNIIILLFFTMAGILLYIMMWRILKNKIQEENNRRNLTNAMAHSLKTPLFVIGGYSENLIENVQTQKRQHYALSIKNQAEIMNDLIHQMLEFSNMEAGDFPVNKEHFSLLSLAESVLADYVNAKITFISSDKTEIFADKELMKTALRNLIDNAIKYSTGNIDIEIKDNTFAISNPSEPITKAQLKQIWMPYYRVDNSNNRNGNGLGLSIVKSIFEVHKFRYSADYSDGIFTVKFIF